MMELQTALAGSDLYAARFGDSIANLGDIDNDGFEGIIFFLKKIGSSVKGRGGCIAQYYLYMQLF